MNLGNEHGRAFRDLELEQEVLKVCIFIIQLLFTYFLFLYLTLFFPLKLTYKTGIGAQFGGKYFCHDVILFYIFNKVV